MGSSPSKAEKLKLEKSRKHLQARIDRWHQQAQPFVGSSAAALPLSSLASGGPRHQSRRNTRGRSVSPSNSDDELPVEQMLLRFPSQYWGDLRSRRLRSLCQMELRLRRGQANDSLHKLTELIGTKSWMYRACIRPLSGSQQKKTRSWSQLHRVERRVQLEAAIYRSSRDAMMLLDMTESDRAMYKKLKSDDLKSSTAIAEPNTSGQRHKNLSWIWRINVHEGQEMSEGLIECTSAVHLH